MTTAGLHPVEDRTLRAQVARQILDMVVSGQFEPGRRLTEIALASDLHVSRAPLREALRELMDRGILISQPYRGLYVREVSARDARELYTLRSALERLALTLAWPLRDAAALKRLKALYTALIAAQTSGNRARSVEAEIAFHSWAFETSGNRLLLAQWARLVPLLQIYLSHHHRVHGSHGVFRLISQDYQRLAAGDQLEPMLTHLDAHMAQGLAAILDVLEDAG